jgi:hypothetical protein
MCFSRARTRYYWIFAIASRCYVTRASDPVELTAFDLLNQMCSYCAEAAADEHR